MNGVKGYIVRGRGTYTANSIFLPDAGYGFKTSLMYSGSYYAGSRGYYWSSIPDLDNYYSMYLSFNSLYPGSTSDGTYGSGTHRYIGQSVRPVQGFPK